MDISDLLELKRAPISTLKISMKPIDTYMAQVNSNIFLLFTKFAPDLSVLHEPDVTSFVWASSFGAVRRVLKFEIEADEGIFCAPPLLMIFNGNPTYEELLANCKARWPSATLETASYRIATDGKFICRNIETPIFSYHFRSSGHDDNEVPFVIEYKLPKG